MRLITSIITIGSAVLITACGGGGGGGSDSAPDTSVVYSGVETQAAISADNAQPIIEAVVGPGTKGGAVGGVDVESTSNQASALALLATVIKDIDLPNTVAGVDINETESCPSGGTFRINGSVNENTGAFNARVTFSQCNQLGSILSGETTLVGTVDLFTGEYIGPVEIEMNRVSVRDGSSEILTSGTMTCTYGVFDFTCLQNLRMRDVGSETVYRLQNLEAEYSGNRVTMNGRFFHPAHGYVDLVSVGDIGLLYSTGSDYPISGMIQMRGANNSVSEFYAENSLSYRLLIDADGDSSYEIEEVNNWD